MAEGFALSSQQRRIWQLTERGGMLVRNTLVATLHGVEEHILREAIDIVCVHHEMFKVKFLHQPGLKFPSQVLADDTPDFQSGKAESDGSEIVPIIFSIKPAANGAKSFSMEIHPLYGDSTSLKILWQDISQCYVALQNGEDGAKHFQERFQYIDYSEWQQELAAEPTFSEAGKKWKKIIASERFYETLPFERVPKGPGRIQCGSMELPPMIAGDLERYSNQYQVDVDALMLLNWYRLLTSFNKKILIGSKSPMRYRAELQSVVGPMEKYFPTVINVDQGGFSDQALHLQELISVIASEPESFDLALFGDEQTNFHYLFESIALPSAKEDLPWECQQITDGLEPFRLKLSCCKQDDRPAQIRLYYDDAFYDDRTVQNLLVCFVSRMEEVLKGNDWSTGNIEAVLIDQITKRTIVPPARTTVVERFE
ncbi:MAG: condensation domain-containing protein, partial [Bacteroidota bacterium]